MNDGGLDPSALLGGAKMAEFVEREKRAAFLRSFLDASDALDALAAEMRGRVGSEVGEQTKRDAKTIDMVVRRVWQALDSVGVSRMPGVGEFVDLDCQEVVETRTSEAEADTILDEIVRGYHWEGRPLRFAKVVIASESAGAGTETASEEDDNVERES